MSAGKRADVGIRPYADLIFLFVGDDAHIVPLCRAGKYMIFPLAFCRVSVTMVLSKK